MQSRLVLILNCGSSSIKFSVLNPDSGEEKIRGILERIQTKDASLSWQNTREKNNQKLPNIDYKTALKTILSLIQTLKDYKQIAAVGHRVVHGGEKITKSVLINPAVIKTIKNCAGLAPLHNPANLQGIHITRQVLRHIPQIAVFDTAFHHTMPDYAFIYPIPYEWYKKHQVRRYGFHGISHQYVTQKAADILKKPFRKCSFISTHLGNGCSITAVSNGQSVDTSMGLTPLEGLMMGTRSGNVDPGLHAYLADKLHLDVHGITNALNKKSGLLGVSGLVSDMRSILKIASSGNKRAQLAIEIFCYRLAKYIAAFFIPAGSIDALIFTGGIGENATLIRQKVLEWLKPLGFIPDKRRNETHGRNDQGCVTAKTSVYKAFVIPTHEDLLIAKEAKKFIHIKERNHEKRTRSRC